MDEFNNNNGMPNNGMPNDGMPNDGMPNDGGFNGYQNPEGMDPGYGMNPNYNMPPSDGKGMSIAGMILGIVGIVSFFVSAVPGIGVIGFICAILGIIFGVKGRKKSTMVYGRPSGAATAGLVLGIIGVAFASIGLICGICVCAGIGAAGLAGLGSIDPSIFN